MGVLRSAHPRPFRQFLMFGFEGVEDLGGFLEMGGGMEDVQPGHRLSHSPTVDDQPSCQKRLLLLLSLPPSSSPPSHPQPPRKPDEIMIGRYVTMTMTPLPRILDRDLLRQQHARPFTRAVRRRPRLQPDQPQHGRRVDDPALVAPERRVRGLREESGDREAGAEEDGGGVEFPGG